MRSQRRVRRVGVVWKGVEGVVTVGFCVILNLRSVLVMVMAEL